ncbi:hypothetical protein [Novosphingobium mangrovi (ex Huang et al. 2023)]|uniref:HEAT repeat domain-containing protein n=1 Tax=Novosphingobium mangrovi (ex Huang et al. 2023) TaxID=2976432 RepID=A0ABT2I704_9SPHN|nr:hypothetical protein [Novosphingobium mangrovi (ex Huang et al. 2023)]MCT2400600.1 hypothetical protein [Novosphingobium mangrovi (ex Huang et al. 2023)]
MNIYEFCEQFRVPLGKARKMEKAGVLILDSGESEYAAEIRLQLRKGQPLTVLQILHIIEDRGILSELWQYTEKAKGQFEALGNFNEEAAPKEVAYRIRDAAHRDDAAISVMVGWLMEAIPDEPVRHHWLAVRLLLGIPASVRKLEVPYIRSALLNCRKSPDFARWWRSEQVGSVSRTVYQRPERLYDL